MDILLLGVALGSGAVIVILLVVVLVLACRLRKLQTATAKMIGILDPPHLAVSESNFYSTEGTSPGTEYLGLYAEENYQEGYLEPQAPTDLTDQARLAEWYTAASRDLHLPGSNTSSTPGVSVSPSTCPVHKPVTQQCPCTCQLATSVTDSQDRLNALTGVAASSSGKVVFPPTTPLPPPSGTGLALTPFHAPLVKPPPPPSHPPPPAPTSLQHKMIIANLKQLGPSTVLGDYRSAVELVKKQLPKRRQTKKKPAAVEFVTPQGPWTSHTSLGSGVSFAASGSSGVVNLADPINVANPWTPATPAKAVFQSSTSTDSGIRSGIDHDSRTGSDTIRTRPGMDHVIRTASEVSSSVTVPDPHVESGRTKRQGRRRKRKRKDEKDSEVKDTTATPRRRRHKTSSAEPKRHHHNNDQ